MEAAYLTSSVEAKSKVVVLLNCHLSYKYFTLHPLSYLVETVIQYLGTLTFRI